MAKVTHVKKAQQRYQTVPVLDENGQQAKTQVFRADGSPKKTKRGNLVFRKQSVEDNTQPLPPYNCDHCGNPIEVGQAYKWIAPKSGPYGGSVRRRHENHPDWNVWEYSSSLSARLALIEHDADEAVQGIEDETEAQAVASEIADWIRELATEKEEGADNIESGFGHETEQSQELRDQADSLNSWADDVENITIPDYPERDDDEDPEDDEKADAGDEWDERVQEWQDETAQAILDELSNVPV